MHAHFSLSWGYFAHILLFVFVFLNKKGKEKQKNKQTNKKKKKKKKKKTRKRLFVGFLGVSCQVPTVVWQDTKNLKTTHTLTYYFWHNMHNELIHLVLRFIALFSYSMKKCWPRFCELTDEIFGSKVHSFKLFSIPEPYVNFNSLPYVMQKLPWTYLTNDFILHLKR